MGIWRRIVDLFLKIKLNEENKPKRLLLISCIELSSAFHLPLRPASLTHKNRPGPIDFRSLRPTVRIVHFHIMRPF